jgi:DNA-directed RNA polymerase alpha subunit
MIALDKLKMSGRLRNVLKDENCKTLEDATAHTKRYWLHVPNVGYRTMLELATLVAEYDLEFVDEMSTYEMIKAIYNKVCK